MIAGPADNVEDEVKLRKTSGTEPPPVAKRRSVSDRPSTQDDEDENDSKMTEQETSKQKRRKDSRDYTGEEYAKRSLDRDKERSSPAVPTARKEYVYIPHLPSNNQTDEELEKNIRRILETGIQLLIDEIQCYSLFDLGVICLRKKEDKDRLLKYVRETFVGTESKEKVTFVDELEFVSYVVFDTKNGRDPPSSDEINEHWQKSWNDGINSRCEPLCPEFPNIFRLVTSPFDKLLTFAPPRKLLGQSITIYHRPDCCFFMDVPENFTLNGFYSALSDQISVRGLNERSVYVQHDPVERRAVVLTCGDARRWSSFKSIKVNGHEIEKRTKLTPKPARAVRDKRPKEEQEEEEITASNWYGRRMLQRRSTIVEYITEPNHPIFQWKWNPEAFLEQFNRLKAVDRHGTPHERDRRGTETNEQRHLLRMTVMLNTIGMVKRGQYSINGKVHPIKTDPLKTIVYTHPSKLKDRMTTASIDIPHKSTKVEVWNEDCLVAYQRLTNRGYHPLLLNMANAKSTGGGYRKGDGAQEENLFRRSNYYRSLDIELDDHQPTKRYFRSSDAQDVPVSRHQKIYPIDEFGAIYTSGLTVFRQIEENGYALMEEPLVDVCALAIAAYRNPRLTDTNLLSSKFSIGTRKKIETIFAIAEHQQHDCLVLSALGCGAFHNPPEHVALIFKSVIEQYAGFFRKIVFAIIDDHNARQELNPDGNFLPFHKILDGEEFKPNASRAADVMVGPWKVASINSRKEMMLSDVIISSLTPCQYGAKCRDREKREHLRDYLHPSRCPLIDASPEGCSASNDENHFLWFQHPNHDAQHRPRSTLTLCPWTPFHCPISESVDGQRHCREFLHICRFGRNCDLTTASHLETTKHVARRECPGGSQCPKLTDDNHLNSFSHAGIEDIRHLCRVRLAECPDREKVDHRVRFRHPANTDRLGVIPFNRLNSKIDFLSNQQMTLGAINRIFPEASLKVSQTARQCIRALFPVYQCSKKLFEAILVHGHVMSSDYLSQLTETDHLVRAIEQNRRIQPIIEPHRGQPTEDRIRSFIRAILTVERSSPYSNGDVIRREEKYLTDFLTRGELDVIIRQILTISDATKHLDDQDSKSEKCLRTRLAPVLGLDNGEIVLVFRREVMHHPDANFSIQARNAFAQGTVFENCRWIKDPRTARERIDEFHRSKLHCSIPGYEDTAAAAIFAAVATKKKSVASNDKTIIDYLTNANSDHVFEGHLPDLIPLDYIEDVFIARATFDSLSRSVQELVKSTFTHSLHVITSSQSGRFEYERDVTEQLVRKHQENMSKPSALSGTVISLPASHFKHFVLLPFTIEQVTHGSNEVFIYWQSMFGDMMITLFNPSEKKYLVCYIAKTPSTESKEYQESSSYLNDADPSQHRKVVEDKSFRANSNTFHRGCDLENYLTYCLKLETNTGDVTLSQAGSNSLYSREKISYRFDKSKLDLNGLNFIQISAGSQPVFIRNLLVSSTEINEFHPSIDEHFQRPDQISPKKGKPHEMHRSSSLMESVPALAHAAVHAVGNFLGLSKDLTPCRYSVNCLEQTSEKHYRQYSHPCRFSELCCRKDREPHLTHESYGVTTCSHDQACTLLSDPYHRARCRHSNLPEFLVPCRDQRNCRDYSSRHRIKYSHGELVLPSAAAPASARPSNALSLLHRDQC